MDIIHITVKYFYQQYIESSSTSLHFYYLTVNMQHEWCLNRMNAFFATPLSMEAYNGLALFANPTIVSNRISFIKESWIHWRFHLVDKLWFLIYAIILIFDVFVYRQVRNWFTLFVIYKFITYHHFTNFISQESFYPMANQCKLLNINLFRNNKTNIIDR